MQAASARANVSERALRAQIIAEGLNDFRKFCSLLEIKPKSGGRIPFVLSPLQRAYCAQRTQRDIILKPRQIGITTVECAYDLFTFLTKPSARVTVVCQSATDQAPFKDISEIFRIYFESLRRWGVRMDIGREAAGEWTLPKQGGVLRIVQAGASEAAAGKRGRAGTITRLHVTEAAFFEYADTTFNSLLESVPSVEHGSSVVNESTPNGGGGFYYEQWQAAVRGQNGYTPHFFKWWDEAGYRTPLEDGEIVAPESVLEEKLVALGVRPDQLKWYRQKVAEKGKDHTLQEYPSDAETCFLVSGRPFFDIETTNTLIHAAKAPLRSEMHGALRVWKEPERDAKYVMAVDTSEGISGDGSADGADYTAAPILNRKTGEHVATLHGRWPTHEAARLVAAVGVTFNNALIAVERNMHGSAVLVCLSREQKYTNVYRWDDEKPGWPTTAITRPVMLDELDDAHRQGLFKSQDELLLGEFRTFVIPPNGKPQASRGSHDDLVIAMAIAWAVRGKPGAARGMGQRPVLAF